MGYYQAGGTIAMLPSHTTSSPSSSSSGPSSHEAVGGRKRPSMNAMNVRAARRAMRRLSSFERIARRVIHFTKPSAGRRFKFGKKRGRR